jgi:hypothetical protein
MWLRLSPRIERGLVWLLFRPALVLALTAGVGIALMEASAAAGGYSDKVLHLAAFMLLGFLADYSLPSAPAAYWRWQVPLLLLYGGMIEILQSYVPHRTADIMDFVADAAGLLIYGALRPLLALLWRPPWSPR